MNVPNLTATARDPAAALETVPVMAPAKAPVKDTVAVTARTPSFPRSCVGTDNGRSAFIFFQVCPVLDGSGKVKPLRSNAPREN